MMRAGTRGFPSRLAHSGLGAEMIANGTFGADTSSWSIGGTATFTAAGGIATLTNNLTTLGYAFQILATIPGRRYFISGTLNPGAGSINPRLLAGTTELASDLKSLQSVGAATYSGYFVATTSTTWITVTTNSVTSGAVATFDDISVKPVL